MAINVSQAFHRTSANPVDESMALTKAQMLTVNDNLMPAYYFTICQDDGEIYLYDKTATASPTTGKFTKFEGGGGGGTEGVVITQTLLASGWDANNRQTLTFTGYEITMGGVIGMPTSATAAQKEAYAGSIINVYSQSGNQFTFECEEKPSIDLPVTLYAGGAGGGGGSGVPEGGTTGQALVKRSSTDGDVEWSTINSIPNGGSTGQALVKHSATDKDVEWADTEKIQYNTMPTASATNEGQIVQFVGTTTANYINGLFYECVSDGAVTPTYSWEQKDVQNYPEVNLNNVFAGGMPSANMTGQQIHYSTNEQVIGTWIDGKPLYQITIETTTPSTTGWKANWIDCSALDIDKLISQKGFYYRASDNWISDAPITWLNSNNDNTYIAWGYITNTKYIGINTNSSNYCSSPIWLTLQYTKTTD